MKVYFTCSARGEGKYEKYYQLIWDEILRHGHEQLCDLSIKPHVDAYYRSDDDFLAFHYRDTMQKIQAADVVILELSVHSLSMGYVMHAALDLGKPVVGIYLSGCIPAFAMGVKNERLQVVQYTENDLGEVLKTSFEFAEEWMETRFTMLIDGKIKKHLDAISIAGRSRSEYIRGLIEKDMGK